MGINLSKDVEKSTNTTDITLKTKCGSWLCCRNICDEDTCVSSCCEIKINNITNNPKPPTPPPPTNNKI